MVDSLLHDIAAKLQSQGLRMGRQTYGEYSDAEVSMARAAWCTVLHQRPSVVVETGVARGVTSRVVLAVASRPPTVCGTESRSPVPKAVSLRAASAVRDFRPYAPG